MAAKKSTTKSAPVPMRWATLAHAGGNAKNLPALLVDLTKKSTHEEADEQLRDLLATKGKVFSASGPALTQLVELAAQKKLERRGSFVELAIWVLALGDTGPIDRTGVDLTMPTVAKRYGSAEAKGVVEAATTNASILAALIDDKDATLRAAVAHFLGLLPSVDPPVIDALGAGLASEGDEGVQASLALALGMLGRNATGQRSAALAFISAFRKRAGLTPLAKGAATLAVALSNRGLTKDVGPEDLALLFEGMGRFSAQFEPTSHDDSFRRAVSWNGGRLDLLALEGLRFDEAAHDAVIRALALALRTTSLSKLSTLNAEWPNIVLAEAGFPTRDLREDPLPAAALSELQRTLLVDLSQRPSAGAFDAHGIAPDIRSRRRFLGIDAPSVMERELPFGKARKAVPVWQIARMGVDEFEGKNPEVDLFVEPEKLLSQVRKSTLAALSEADWLDLWVELDSGAYDLTIPVQVVKAALDTSSPSERAAFAKRWAAEIRRHPEALASSSCYVFHALAKDLGPGKSYPEEYEDVFTFFGLEEDMPALFSKIAPAHREGVALRELDHHPVVADRILDFADLAPKAAATFKERRRKK